MKFKNLSVALLIGIISLFAVSCGNKQAAGGKPDNVDYYTCTMHPSVRSQNPNDKCPICGMDLVPVLKKNATTNVPESPAKNKNQAAAKTGERKIKFYKSTINPKKPSPVPANDSMSMKMEPV